MWIVSSCSLPQPQALLSLNWWKLVRYELCYFWGTNGELHLCKKEPKQKRTGKQPTPAQKTCTTTTQYYHLRALISHLDFAPIMHMNSKVRAPHFVKSLPKPIFLLRMFPNQLHSMLPFEPTIIPKVFLNNSLGLSFMLPRSIKDKVIVLKPYTWTCKYKVIALKVIAHKP